MKGCDGVPVSSTGERHFSGNPHTNWREQHEARTDLLTRFRERLASKRAASAQNEERSEALAEES